MEWRKGERLTFSSNVRRSEWLLVGQQCSLVERREDSKKKGVNVQYFDGNENLAAVCLWWCLHFFLKLCSTCYFYLPGMFHDNLCFGFETSRALSLMLLPCSGCCRLFILL